MKRSFAYRVRHASRVPRRILSYAISTLALIALILLLRTLFTAQSQSVAPITPLPIVTVAVPSPQPIVTAAATAPRPTYTPPSGRDFYQVRRLTTTVSGAFRPAVSPDGRRIAYASERNGNWDIYVLDRTSGQEARLTDDPLNDMAPSWSPDGMHLTYQHNVPTSNGPVLVDRIVMNPDGSNKTTVSSGAYWLKNEAPAWSPAGDQIAFTDGQAVVVVDVNTRREVRRFAASEGPVYRDPAWLDNDRIVFTSDNVLLTGRVNTGAIEQTITAPGLVRWVSAHSLRLVYISQNGSTADVSVQALDGSDPTLLAQFQAQAIDGAALSPDGHFVAIQTEADVVVVTDRLPALVGTAPLFRIDSNMPSTDLNSVAWLPDGSGFVFVAAIDGQPDLYLATLNTPAIDAFVSTPPPIGLPANPKGLPAFVTAVSFSPDLSLPLDHTGHFGFGAAITATVPISSIAHIVAFALRPGEAVYDCAIRNVPTDRPFWANQANFAPGQVVYGQEFAFSDDVPDANRLVVRISLLDTSINSQVLYCAQHVYQLMWASQPPTIGPFTPTPTAIPVEPPPPMPTAHWLTPMPSWYFWVSDRFAVRLQYPSHWQAIPNQPDRMGASDGFVQLSAENGDPVVMKVCQAEVNHPTHPYGTAPVIESLTVNGQAACLILPSGDQPPDMQRQAMLIAQYPQPVSTILSGTTYTYFVVWADEQHIHSIAWTIEFLPPGAPTPFPTQSLTPFPTPTLRTV